MSKLGKKLRKLRRDPGKFVDDFIANRKRQLATLRRKSKDSFVAGAVKTSRRYSVVSAVYNVEPYLDEYFRSLVAQTLDFENCIELVMVDDGSPDGSAAIIRKWQRKYPNNIKYLRKENGGQASARNLGLEYATARWVTFIDPDDFVAPDYFEQVEKVIAEAKQPPAMVSCNFIFYFANGKRYSDTHPLKYRFAKGTQAVDFSKPTSHIQLSVNSAFFDAEVIEKHLIRFDDRIKPNFEDAHFVNRYLVHTEGRHSVFCQPAKYLYRKRSDGTSTLDTAWEKEGLYSHVLEHGVLALIRDWSSRTGSVPVFVQRIALYHLIWYFRRLINDDNRLAFLTDEQRVRFIELLHEIFAYIDRETIDKFELGGIWFLHRVGLIGTFKDVQLVYQIVYADNVDFNRRLIKLRYFTSRPGFESFRFDDIEVKPVFSTSRSHTFAGRPFVQERIVWLPLRQHAKLTVMLECEDVRLSHKGKHHRTLPVAEICAHFEAARQRVPTNLGRSTRLVRRLAKLPFVQKKYHAAWALMDRDVQADDNAEHLYRYLRNSQPEINAFFVLARASHDWKRLKREDFRLIAFGGLRHKLLLLNSDHLISSHIDRYVVDALPSTEYGDQLKHRLTFLQHGITQNDIADWLNTKEIDCFVTSAPREYHSIADAGTRYKFSAREVTLSGLPRHDGIVRESKHEKILLVMPTWRKSLMGAAVPGTFRRELNPEFAGSSYFKEWNGLLAKEALSELARRHGYRIVFYPHANIQDYSHLFNLPDNVDLLLHADGSIQDVFKSAAVMITDYSSVAFEFGLMRRPLVYFQFDHAEVFSGGHIVQKGYFDYKADGFGPVCDTRSEVLDAVARILADDCKMAPDYLARAEAFLPLRDGRNCERTFEAIKALDKPAVAPRPTAIEAMGALEQAVGAAKWQVVIERVSRILALDDVTAHQRMQTLLRGSQAWRELGDSEKAHRLLQTSNLDPHADGAVATEFAEVASMRKDWSEAAALWQSVVARMPASCDAETRTESFRKLIDALLELRREADALACATQLLNTNDETRRALPSYAELSRVALASGEAALARRFALATLNSSDPDIDSQRKARALATLATVLQQQGDSIKARGIWMRALRAEALDETCVAAFDSLVDSQESWSRDDWTDACDTSSMFSDVLGRTQKVESAHELDVALVLCAMHRSRGEFEVAKEILGTIELSYPKDVFIRLEAAELALIAGDYEKAEKDFAFAHATPCGAQLSRVAWGLLVTRQALGKLKNLNSLALAVVAKRPNDVAAARAYAMIATAEARWEDAYNGWQTVLTLTAPENARALTDARLKLAEAALRLGRLEEAQQALARLPLDSPEETTQLRALAELAAERGDWELAISTWGQVERKASSLGDRRHASRMLTQALWCAGHEDLARDRMWREMEGAAFAALASDDLPLAARHLSRLAQVRNSSALARGAGAASSASTATCADAQNAAPKRSDHAPAHAGDALKTSRLVTALVCPGEDD